MEYDLRDLYESYTKDIRYKSYEYAAKLSNYDNINVIMGHNKDDCFENIITNIVDKSKYENLNGMEQMSVINNLIFCRPILNVPKSEIYNYALKNNLPFLCDSTPKWSRRGKIRDIIRPTLIGWEAESLNGFYTLADTMRELSNINQIVVNSYVQKLANYDMTNNKLKPLDKIKTNNMQYMKIKLSELINTKIFWMTFFNKLKIYCSQRSIDELVNRLNKFKSGFDNMFLNELELQQICKNCRIIFFKTDNETILFIIAQ